jgi:hypothetical protein
VGEEPGWQVVLSWVRRLQGAHEAHAFGSSFTLQYEILTPRRINSTLFACPVPRTRLPSWHCRIPRKAGVLYRPRVRDIPVQPQKRRVKRRRLEELRSCIEAVFPCVPQSQTPTAQWKDHSPSLFATQPLVRQTWVICRPYLAGCLPDRAMVKLHLGLPLSLLAPVEHANRQISESERTRALSAGFLSPARICWFMLTCDCAFSCSGWWAGLNPISCRIQHDWPACATFAPTLGGGEVGFIVSWAAMRRMIQMSLEKVSFYFLFLGLKVASDGDLPGFGHRSGSDKQFRSLDGRSSASVLR